VLPKRALQGVVLEQLAPMTSTVELLRVTAKSPSCDPMPPPPPATVPGCQALAAALQTRAWPLVGAAAETERVWIPLTVALPSGPERSPPVVGLTGDLPLSCACTSELRFARYPQMVFVTVPAPILAASIPAPSCVFVAVPVSWENA